MKNLILLPIFSTLFSCFAIAKSSTKNESRFTIFHYNIRELESHKLKGTNLPKQLQNVREILNAYQFDILSIQEMQYDFEGIPDASFKTTGHNMKCFVQKMGLEEFKDNITFAPANTGKYALKNDNGNFFLGMEFIPSREATDEIADPLSFGVFPGQYSSALATRHQIVDRNIFTDIKWKEFNPQINLSDFTDHFGKPLTEVEQDLSNRYGKKIEMDLFDKNFSDTTISIDGKKIHLISLHTVPSFGFGNKNSPNYLRNRDQMRFLEWYVTGKTDIPVYLEHIKPLEKGSRFIIVGDLNTDVRQIKNPGSVVLKRLIDNNHIWKDYNDPTTYTYENLSALWDYIIYSDGLELTNSGIVKEFRGSKVFLKQASDHLPIHAEFIIK